MSYNKNLKLYVQNSNKSGKTEMYHQVAQLYQEEINNINKKISNGIPLERALNEIKSLMHKFSIYKTIVKPNTLLGLQQLKNNITYKKELENVKLLYTNTSNTLIQIKQDLEYALINLADYKKSYNNKKSGFKINDVSLNINTELKKEYIIYIRDYGVPLNGIFLEPILKYIKDINNL